MPLVPIFGDRWTRLENTSYEIRLRPDVLAGPIYPAMLDTATGQLRKDWVPLDYQPTFPLPHILCRAPIDRFWLRPVASARLVIADANGDWRPYDTAEFSRDDFPDPGQVPDGHRRQVITREMRDRAIYGPNPEETSS